MTKTITVSTVHPGSAGGAIFTGADSEGRKVRAVVNRRNIFRAPIKGEVWQLTGKFINHPKYGEQLYVEQSRLLPPAGRLLVRYLTTNPAFRGLGIGQAKASRLYKELGDELPDMLDRGDVEHLATLIGKDIAQTLVDVWRQNIQQSSAITFLDRHGVDLRLAGKILRYWPENPIEKIRENPYRLLVLTSWSSVDLLATSLGIDGRDERRLIAAAEASVYDRMDSAKDTLVEPCELERGVGKLLCSSNRSTCRQAVELAVTDAAIVGDDEKGYQPFGCVVMERYLASRLSRIAYGDEQSQLKLFAGGINQLVVDASISAVEQEEGITLNDEQRAAVLMGLTEPLSVLTGGAGVGKTTVLKAIHHAVESSGGFVVQMALAGRAAQRMRETTGRDAHTIVGFLNKVRVGKMKLGQRHLIIIDESSMLDLMLAYRVVRALPEGVRLLFVGDPHQLPPIGPGLVFHKLAESKAITVQELTRVHRQAETTGIPQVAKLIRSGVIPDLPSFNGSSVGVSFLECRPAAIIPWLVDIVGDLGGFHEAQIVGVTKGGPAGVTNINDTFHQKLTSARPKLPGWTLAESDAVIYTANDYERELYNGSLGHIEQVMAESFRDPVECEAPTRLVCNFDGRQIKLIDADLGNVELAYAITTHKAQGSQFKRVIIPVTKSRLLDRTLVYTALTRGVEQVVFIGERHAFDQAVVKPPSATLRNVGFSI